MKIVKTTAIAAAVLAASGVSQVAYAGMSDRVLRVIAVEPRDTCVAEGDGCGCYARSPRQGVTVGYREFAISAMHADYLGPANGDVVHVKSGGRDDHTLAR